MIWFARCNGDHTFTFAAPSEARVGDELHLHSGPLSGRYRIENIVETPGEPSPYNFTLVPLDDETTMKHWGRDDFPNGPPIAISPPLEVLYADQKV